VRNSVLISGIVHLALFVALFWVRTPVTVVVPGPESVQVQLVELGRVQAPAPPAPAPERKTPELAVKPATDEPGVKLAQQKPKKKPAPVPEEEPAAPAAQLPAAPVGAAGLRGEVAVDAANFEFTYYLLVIRNRIASVWSPPAGLAPGGEQIRTVVYFRITRSGEIAEIRLEKPSGVSFFDQSAIRAVTIANPMPPLPLGFSAPDLGVHFGFEFGG
jgi:TonB family protein